MNTVSIIIPVYNAEKTLDRCLNSVVNQTYKDIEIILVNDGSKDNSGKICDRWADKDARIKVIHKENGGASSARNKGIENAVGEYICFVDSDDYVEEKYVEIMHNWIKQEGAQLAVCAREQFLAKEFDDEIVNVKGNLSRKHLMLLFSNWMYGPCNKMYLREIFLKNNITFDSKVLVGEDVLLVYQYLKQCSKVVYCHEKLYFADRSASTLSKTYMPYIKEYNEKIFPAQIDFLEKLTLSAEVEEKIASYLAVNIFSYVTMHYLPHVKGKKAVSLFKEIYKYYCPYFRRDMNDFVFEKTTQKWIDKYYNLVFKGNIRSYYYKAYILRKVKETVNR